MFQSTSQYTLRLQEALKEFENPHSENYQDKEKLKEAAQSYLNYRGVHNRAEALRESSAPRNSSFLCLDLIAAVDATKDNVPINLNEKDDIIIEINKNNKDDLFVDH